MREITRMVNESWYKRPLGISEHTSAGGVVVRWENARIYVALIREKGYRNYILPKGHVDEGESLERAARREIEEEAGLTNLKLVSELGVRERLDHKKESWKKTCYFLFVTDQVEGIPTDSKHHYQLTWFPIDNLPSLFWPEQEELIETNRNKIAKSIKSIKDSQLSVQYRTTEDK